MNDANAVVLPKGRTKIILAIPNAAEENRLRLGAGGKRFIPVWQIVLPPEVDGDKPTIYRAATFKAKRLTPQYAKAGFKAPWLPSTLHFYQWMETTEEVVLSPTFLED